MKVVAILFALVATASAFSPVAFNGRSSTALNEQKEEKKTFFDTVFGMDLFAPNPDVNTYGARQKKNLKEGKIGKNSYVPSGLSATEYNKIRNRDSAKKQANYQKNVAKAFKFQDYTDFYLKRGTDTKDDWKKSVTLGHTMAKTKYDYSGKQDLQKGYDGSKK